MKPVKLFLFIILFGLFTSCSGQPERPIPDTALASPTALSLFAEQGTIPANNLPVAGSAATVQPSAGNPLLINTPEADLPSLTPYPTATWLPTQPLPPSPVEVPVYTDFLSSGWRVVSPDGEMSFDLNSRNQAHSGTNAIAITPNKSHGKVYIVADQSNTSVYPRTNVLGIRFWIYSGERGLDQYDLALTAIGSNVYTYWREDDYSVISKTPYEETFLRWFGYDQNIAPFTWAPVTIWLNEMRFDPDYKNVTGLYITNRQGFTRTFYVDDVSLLLQPTESQTNPTLTLMP